MSRFVPIIASTGLLLHLTATPAAFAADAPREFVEPVAPPVIVEQILPPVPLVVVSPTYRDPRTGRCLAGFTLNRAGACVRHDDPDVVCTPADLGPDLCYVAPPNPAPYGIGASLRLNY